MDKNDYFALLIHFCWAKINGAQQLMGLGYDLFTFSEHILNIF